MWTSISSILPEWHGGSGSREHASQSLHRRVGGQDHHLAAFRRERRRALDRRGPLVDYFHALLRETGIFETESEIAPAQPRDDGVLDRRRKGLEVCVPNPRHVAAVRVAIAQRGEEARGAAGLEKCRDRRVEARRVLHEHEPERPALVLDRLESTERRPKIREGADRLSETEVERTCGRESGERVVRVVETWDRNTHGLEDASHSPGERDLARIRAEPDLRS